MRSVAGSLLDESKAILKHLSALEQALEAANAWGIRKHLRLVAGALAVHQQDEDEVVLPILRRHLNQEACASAVVLRAAVAPDRHWSQFLEEVRAQTDRLRGTRAQLAAELGALQRQVETDPCPRTESEIQDAGRRLAERLRSYLEEEGLLLTPLLDRLLTDGEKAAVHAGMTERRRHRGHG